MGFSFSKRKHNFEDDIIYIFIHKIAHDYYFKWIVEFNFEELKETCKFEMDELLKTWDYCVEKINRNDVKIKPGELVFNFMNYLCENSLEIQIRAGIIDENKNLIHKLKHDDYELKIKLGSKFAEELNIIWNILRAWVKPI